MNKDDITKKIIKEKFDNLDIKFIMDGRVFALLTDNTYGIYIDRFKVDAISINGNYFMFRYLGANDNSTLKKYGEYVIELIKNKYELHIESRPILESIDFDSVVIDNIYRYFIKIYKKEVNKYD